MVTTVTVYPIIIMSNTSDMVTTVNVYPITCLTHLIW